MSEEAPKKIEELLQRYAKKRREQGGDFSLHPATRQLLQGEVRRQHGRAKRPQSNLLAWFGLWRGRFAFGVAAAAVLVLTTWMIWNSQQPDEPMQLARNESVRDAEKSMEARGVAQTEPLTEAAKTVALAEAPRPIDESRDGVSRKEPAPGLAAPTMSLTPAANAPARGQASDFFSSANGPVPSTNRFAYVAPKAAEPDTWAVPPAAPGVQLSYSDNTKADRAGLGSTTQPVGIVTGAEVNIARLSVAATDTGAVGANALYANNFQAKEVAANLAVADPKRLTESADAQSRSDVAKPQTESLAFGVNRSAAEESLARNRRLNINQPGAAGGTQLKGAVDSLAVVDNPAATPAEAKAKTDVALNVPAQAAGNLQGDAPTATRFYRQTELGQLNDVVQMERETDVLKKAGKSEAGQVVLGRFTVEQQGTWLRIREPDGSVYEGPITGPVVAANAESSGARDKDTVAREKVVTLKSSVSNRDGEYSFQASGSNVTLRQMIVVNGRLSAADDSISPSAGAAAPAPAPLRPAPVQRTPASAASGRSGGAAMATNRISRIEGTVRVGATNEQQFKAVRATR